MQMDALFHEERKTTTTTVCFFLIFVVVFKLGWNWLAFVEHLFIVFGFYRMTESPLYPCWDVPSSPGGLFDWSCAQLLLSGADPKPTPHELTAWHVILLAEVGAHTCAWLVDKEIWPRCFNICVPLEFLAQDCCLAGLMSGYKILWCYSGIGSSGVMGWCEGKPCLIAAVSVLLEFELWHQVINLFLTS